MKPKYTVEPKALIQSDRTPVAFQFFDDGALLLDFGKAAFGTLILPAGITTNTVVVHLAEKLTAEGRCDRTPQGTVRYIRIEQPVTSCQHEISVTIPQNTRNTGPGAIKMPLEIGEVFPFRYAEIEYAQALDPKCIRQRLVTYPFDPAASKFQSSDATLNAVWQLCKDTVEATSFCGLYIDGDRERIPYEGDAYINQLSHYCVDSEYSMATHTLEYLIQHPTWPTEWQMHIVLMAWMDYLYSGQKQTLELFYDAIRAKTLIGLARSDGLISTLTEHCTREFEESLNLYHDRYVFSHGLRDLVDWPPGSFTDGGQGERDNHDMRPVNTVVNAYHYRALILMSRIAAALGKGADAAVLTRRAKKVKVSFNQVFFDAKRGRYIDGEGSNHSSLHSNLFALAFDLVPAEHVRSVLEFVKSKDMACSVYGAQFLLDALFRHGEAGHALELMTAKHDRSWWHMIVSGSTMTWEAWDHRYKNNLDWNHGWGTAPANIIHRYILGIRPTKPGFEEVLIQPQPGGLTQASGVMPTPNGPIKVELDISSGRLTAVQCSVPPGTSATVILPINKSSSSEPCVNGIIERGGRIGSQVFSTRIGPGEHRVAVPQN